MTGLQFLISLRPALPMSRERPCTPASNSELRRWLRDKAVLVNSYPLEVDEEIDFPIRSLVLFPKAASRCTLV